MLKAPQQQRSEQTLQRILNVCEGLIEQGTFEQASMQDIAKAAEVSVGTLYKRFSAKADIVDYLVARLQTQQYETCIAALRDCNEPTLIGRLRFLTELAERTTREYSGLLRTVMITHLLGRSPITETTTTRSSGFIDEAAGWLDAVPESPGFDACRDAVATLWFSFQYRAIYPTPDALLGADHYTDLIYQMAHAYLGA